MELLETTDPEKKRLIEASNRHKQELQKEVKALSDKTEQVVKNALIIGGTLAVTYLLISQLGSSKKKRKKAAPKSVSKETDELTEVDMASQAGPSFFLRIGERVLSQATVLLLDIAKDKLREYLTTRKAKNENS